MKIFFEKFGDNMIKQFFFVILILISFNLNSLAKQESKQYYYLLGTSFDEKIIIHSNINPSQDLINITEFFTFKNGKRKPINFYTIKFLGVDGNNNLQLRYNKENIIYPLTKENTGNIVINPFPSIKSENQIKIPLEVKYINSELQVKYLGDLPEYTKNDD